MEPNDFCTIVFCSGKGVFPKIRNTEAMSTSRKAQEVLRLYDAVATRSVGLDILGILFSY